ncbi:MAG TPA: hypothetical protein VGG62_02650 [Terracidiphilus sp.]|jgi:hypothetical protein
MPESTYTPKAANWKDLTGQRFGRLIALEPVGSHHPSPNKHSIIWRCRCDCGAEVNAIGDYLRCGDKTSCGCKGREGLHRRSHGHSRFRKRTPEYTTWKSMRTRCTDPNCNRYKHYGGRGIRICERWADSFENFLADMGPRPPGRYSIERVDVNGHYEPTNCIWLPMSEQSKNRRHR